MGPKTIDLLRWEGFTHALDLWDVQRSQPQIPSLPFIGPARRSQLETWVVRSVVDSERAAIRNERRLAWLDKKIDAIDAMLRPAAIEKPELLIDHRAPASPSHVSRLDLVDVHVGVAIWLHNQRVAKFRMPIVSD